jgi:hypothetical protein
MWWLSKIASGWCAVAVEEWTARCCVQRAAPARVMCTECSDTRWWWSYDKSRTHTPTLFVTPLFAVYGSVCVCAWEMRVSWLCVFREHNGWGGPWGGHDISSPRRPFAVQELGQNRLIIDRMAGVCVRFFCQHATTGIFLITKKHFPPSSSQLDTSELTPKNRHFGQFCGQIRTAE